ncbi:MAG TPA: type II toxin-antitoxin system prevent-host-death family antitoxin [Methylomirabilota bacterium]|nr:type II toxin-antitoxin system prevent-host-death family antitoxin [Methylomirabilota bacterium]
MKTISARDANQRFSRLLTEVAAGEEVVITRRGKPVARLLPVADAKSSKRRQAAIKRMVEMMNRGLDLGGLTFKRDELYDR